MRNPDSSRPTSAGELRAEARRDQRRDWRRNGALIVALLLVWLAITFVPAYFARSLTFPFLGWPFSFWMAAYGAPFAYLLIIGLYAVFRNRADRRARAQPGSGD